MSNVKVWFVTGASSGFGLALTKHLLENGSKVVATLRKPEVLSDLTARYPSTQLHVIKLDVTIKADVTKAFTEAGEAFGRIDVVFNNAGLGLTGEVESVDEASAREIFEVNFWGAVWVTQEAVRFFREVNKPIGGRLLQVSSRLGLTGIAACGFYGASKFALEGLSESLANELEPAWNIRVTLLEPGPFRTEFVQGNLREVPQHRAYSGPSTSASLVRKFMGSPEVFDGDVGKAAVIIERVAQLEDPPIRFPLHRNVIGTMRDKATGLVAVADKYQSWSDDLYHEK